MSAFKKFILNEGQSNLGVRLSDILSAMQDLQQDMAGMGLRHITKLVEDIVNQLRKILHSQWSPSQKKFLQEVQKIAVALMKTIEDKGDLQEIIPTAIQALEQIVTKTGVKTNSLTAPEM